MSLIKKGIKAVKKTIKSVTKFVKKHWKTIVVVAAVVFTAGVATLGAGAFMSQMAAAQGFTGFMSTIGSTMYAGATAALGSLGIGGGAAGSAAAAANVTGYGLGAGMGLGGGYGLGAAGSAAAAKAAALPLSGISPLMSSANALSPLASSAGLPSTGASLAVNPATGKAVGTMFQAGSAAAGAAPAATGLPAKAAGFFNNDLTKAALVNTGGQMLSGYAAAKASEEEDPKGYWGVDLSGKGQDVAYGASQPMSQAPQAPQTAGAQAPAAPLTPQQIYEMNQYAMNGGRRGLMNPWAPPQGYAA